MTGDHHGRTARRATLLVRAADEILGTHSEEIGYFQFGGSTHCLVFRPGAIADFSLTAIPQPHDPHPALVPVRSRLATAASG
jgi:hypothetical protein